MIHISPEQRIFTAVRQACVSTGIDTYDFLPEDGVSYPFFFVGEQFSNKVKNNKDQVFLSVQQTVHLYHNDHRQRGTVSSLLDGLLREVVAIRRIGGQKLTLIDDSQQLVPDNTTSTPLMHGIIEFDFEVN